MDTTESRDASFTTMREMEASRSLDGSLRLGRTGPPGISQTPSSPGQALAQRIGVAPGHTGSSSVVIEALKSVYQQLRYRADENQSLKRELERLRAEYEHYRMEASETQQRLERERRQADANHRSMLGRQRAEAQTLRLTIAQKDKQIEEQAGEIGLWRGRAEAAQERYKRAGERVQQLDDSLRRAQDEAEQGRREVREQEEAARQADKRRALAEAKADVLTARLVGEGAGSRRGGGGGGGGRKKKSGGKKKRGAGSAGRGGRKVSLQGRARRRDGRDRPWQANMGDGDGHGQFGGMGMGPGAMGGYGGGGYPQGEGGGGSIGMGPLPAASSAARSRLDGAMRGAASRAQFHSEERERARAMGKSGVTSGGDGGVTSGGKTTQQLLLEANGGKPIPFMPSGRPGPSHSVIGNVQQALSSHRAYGRSEASVRAEEQAGRDTVDGAVERGLGLGGEGEGKVREGGGGEGASEGALHGGSSDGGYQDEVVLMRGPGVSAAHDGAGGSNREDEDYDEEGEDSAPWPDAAVSKASQSQSQALYYSRGEWGKASDEWEYSGVAFSQAGAVGQGQGQGLEGGNMTMDPPVHGDEDEDTSRGVAGPAAANSSGEKHLSPGAAAIARSEATLQRQRRMQDEREKEKERHSGHDGYGNSSRHIGSGSRAGRLGFGGSIRGRDSAEGYTGIQEDGGGRYDEEEEEEEEHEEEEHGSGPRLVAHRTLGPEREISHVLEQMEAEFRSLQDRYSSLVLEAESVARKGGGGVTSDEVHRTAVQSMEAAMARLLTAMQRKGDQLARLREAADRILEARERLPVADPGAHRRKIEALRTFQHLRAVATTAQGRARAALSSASTAVRRVAFRGGPPGRSVAVSAGGVGQGGSRVGSNPARGWAWGTRDSSGAGGVGMDGMARVAGAVQRGAVGGGAGQVAGAGYRVRAEGGGSGGVPYWT